VDTARSDPSAPRAQAAARAAQRWEQERAARAKERRIRQREHVEQYNEEYRLRESRGLPPRWHRRTHRRKRKRAMGGLPERWNPPPLSPRAAEAVVELVPTTGTEASAVGLSVEVPAGPRGRGRRNRDSPQALKEEEAGLLQLEVSSVSPHAPLISRGWRIFFCNFLLIG
jgi:hypothetical protein